MDMIHTVSGALYFATAVLCFLTGSILYYYSYHRHKGNIFLGLSFLMIAYMHFVLFLVQTRLILELPHIYRTGNFFALLCAPFSYLYMRRCIKITHASAWDLIHAIPVLLYLIDLFPFFMLSAAEKKLILEREIYQMAIMTRFSQGWLLPDNFHTPARVVLMAIYWLLQVRLVVKRFYPFSKSDKAVKSWIRWIVLYLGLQLFLFVPPLAILQKYGDENFFWMLFLPASLGALSMAIAVLLNPRLAYGMELNREREKSPLKPKVLPDSEFVMQTSLKLEQYLEANKPFLKQGYALKDLADEMGMPVHQLSGFINQTLGKNFSDLMNYYRIIYCQDLFQKGEANNLNLHGLALKCGFSNRNTFTIAFKKSTGLAPSQYLKMLKDHKSVTKKVKRRKMKKQERFARKR